MVKKARSGQRREDSLSRDRIIEASIELLDESGEEGLTFRALSERLATGPGAIYWHIANKSDLLVAACDAIVSRVVDAHAVGGSPKATIRALALGMFDAMEAHAWVGTALIRAAGQLPTVRVLECIGQQVRALGVAADTQWTIVSVLLNYILGVGGQNAANAQFARTHGLDRSSFLDAVATDWSALDASDYPFARSVAGAMRDHDDRVDYLAGIDLILAGIKGTRTGRT
ncbi:AcrR family transcriptional regulator [Bradyrhizobium sp. USDA 4503]|uniref:TetR/AcrR family transcriptional regulator n=1 Tax=Bradyrhizobium pachyrhizi TaxID=280333 RepID=UPI000704D770|nr:TetR/AcrR family transcriptional regulator [Bradyrhizobium pachyrhizi]KRP87703.1 TetR family transcriptional regulator [Bradyrhizobium pachyrhizi]